MSTTPKTDCPNSKTYLCQEGRKTDTKPKFWNGKDRRKEKDTGIAESDCLFLHNSGHFACKKEVMLFSSFLIFITKFLPSDALKINYGKHFYPSP